MQGSGFKFHGFRFQGLEVRVQGVGSGLQGLGIRSRGP